MMTDEQLEQFVTARVDRALELVERYVTAFEQQVDIQRNDSAGFRGLAGILGGSTERLVDKITGDEPG